MNKAEFLRRLESESKFNLTPEISRALISEVAAHLDESIQSRLELGEPQEIAEINAVAAFAKPENFVHRMEEVHTEAKKQDPVMLGFGMLLVASLTFWIWIVTSGLTSYLGWMGLIFLGPICIFIRSCRQGVPRWMTLRTLAIAAVVMIGGIQPLTVLNLWAYGDMGYLSSLSASSTLEQYRKQLSAPGAVKPSGSFVLYGPDPATISDRILTIEQAQRAPLWERYTTNASEAVPQIVFCIAILLLAHLVPVSVRQMLRRSRKRRARAA